MMIAVSYPRGIQEGADIRDQLYRAVAAGVMLYVYAATVAKAEIMVGQIADW